MTVKDLIERLKEEPEDADIALRMRFMPPGKSDILNFDTSFWTVKSEGSGKLRKIVFHAPEVLHIEDLYLSAIERDRAAVLEKFLLRLAAPSKKEKK